ncbi:hypothetical protein ABE504_17710 [Paenibacillus oryzisoli]|uniref:hypothetical protein n=1 Tax=Paenibacillus oryzisoli TaxID=1850517 RepID=UPI003D29BE2B
MHPFTRKWQWTLLVWIILGLFVFPLTPPISHQPEVNTDALVLASTSQVLTAQPGLPTKEIIQLQLPSQPVYEDAQQRYDTTVFVIFIVYLIYPIWKRLKVLLLAFLKFTSTYMGLIFPSHSVHPTK